MMNRVPYTPYTMEFTMLTDFKAKDLTNMSDVEQKHTGKGSYYDPITPFADAVTPDYSFRTRDFCSADSFLAQYAASSSCSLSWITMIVNAGERALALKGIDEKLSAEFVRKCYTKRDICRGLTMNEIYVNLNRVGLASESRVASETGDICAIPKSEVYHFSTFRPEGPNRGGLMNLVKEGNPVLSLLSIDLLRLRYVKDMRDEGEDVTLSGTVYQPSFYAIVTGYKKTTSEEDGYWIVEGNVSPCEGVNLRLPMRDSETNSNYAGIAGYAFAIEFTEPLDIVVTQSRYPTFGSIPSYAKSLRFAEGIYSELNAVDFSRFANLEEVVFGRNSFSSVLELDLSNMLKLKRVVFEEGAFENGVSLVMDNNPVLEDVELAEGTFNGDSSGRRLGDMPRGLRIQSCVMVHTIVLPGRCFVFATVLIVIDLPALSTLKVEENALPAVKKMDLVQLPVLSSIELKSGSMNGCEEVKMDRVSTTVVDVTTVIKVDSNTLVNLQVIVVVNTVAEKELGEDLKEKVDRDDVTIEVEVPTTMVPTVPVTEQPTVPPTQQPSEQPTTQPTTQLPVQPTEEPTEQPTVPPTQPTTEVPTSQPTEQPTEQPTTLPPTTQPTVPPTEQPTILPPTTLPPTTQPTEEPTEEPTEQPTEEPTVQPTTQPPVPPTEEPTEQPTTLPSVLPTEQPTEQPTEPPTTEAPFTQPPVLPTEEPTVQPTEEPTEEPTTLPPTVPPTEEPTGQPTTLPPVLPTEQPTEEPTTLPPTTQPPTEAPTTLPPVPPTEEPTEGPTEEPTEEPTILLPTTQPPTEEPTEQPTEPPTTELPSTQLPVLPTAQPTEEPTEKPTKPIPTVPPTEGPTPTPTPFICPEEPVIYDPVLFGDNQNVKDALTDIEIVERYLAERDCFPDYALNNTRVIALAGFSIEALELFHESLAKQTPTNRSIDLIFYSDPERQHYYYPESAELLISFAKYTHPTKVVFADGFFKQKGATIVLNYIVEHKEYFQNLEYLEISGHQLALPPEEEEVMSRRLVDGNSLRDALLGATKFIKDKYDEANGKIELGKKFTMNLKNNRWDIFKATRDTLFDKMKEDYKDIIDFVLEQLREPKASICFDNEGAHYSYYDVTNKEEADQCGHLWSHDIGETTVYVDACAEINDLPFGATEINISADICADFGEVTIPPTVETVVLNNPGNITFASSGASSLYIGCGECHYMPTLSFPGVSQVYIGDNSFPTVTEARVSFPKAYKLVIGKLTLTLCKTFELKGVKLPFS